MHLGNGKGNPGLLHNTPQRPPFLISPAYFEYARRERQPNHVRTLAPSLTLPIFRRIMRPHSERSYKALYLKQLYFSHSQFSDAPCVHTAREATQPCTYDSTSSTLNSPTHSAPTQLQQERSQSPVLTTTPCLLLSILPRNLASTQRERQPSPVSQAAG